MEKYTTGVFEKIIYLYTLFQIYVYYNFLNVISHIFKTPQHIMIDHLVLYYLHDETTYVFNQYKFDNSIVDLNEGIISLEDEIKRHNDLNLDLENECYLVVKYKYKSQHYICMYDIRQANKHSRLQKLQFYRNTQDEQRNIKCNPYYRCNYKITENMKKIAGIFGDFHNKFDFTCIRNYVIFNEFPDIECQNDIGKKYKITLKKFIDLNNEDRIEDIDIDNLFD